MVPPKQLGRFCIAAIVVCVILIPRWPGIESGYAYLFRAGGNLLFSETFWCWTEGEVHFIDLRDPDQAGAIERAVGAPVGEGFSPTRAEGAKDTLMILINRRLGGSDGLRTSSREGGYIPTALIIVLVLATPLPWRRRLWTLLWGWVLVQLFIVLRLTVTLSEGFSGVKDHTLFHPSEFWGGILSNVQNVLCDDPFVSWVFPVFVWFLVALRSRIWAARPAEQQVENAGKREGKASPRGGARE